MPSIVGRASVMIASVIDRAVRLAQASSSTTSLVLLVAFNLVPLLGVLFWGWNVATLLVLYWAENGIIGLLNVPKMLLARGPDAPGEGFANTSGRPRVASIAQVPFFLIHYGLFWVVHGIFVFTLPLFVGMRATIDRAIDAIPTAPELLGERVAGSGPDLAAVTIGVVGLAISHGVSFVINYLGRREYLRISPSAQMFAPYGRLMILHLTIIFGAVVSLSLGSPVGAIVVLVLLKTAVDLVLHRREHARLGAGAGAGAATGAGAGTTPGSGTVSPP
jgi:hypothetical protein